MQRSDGRRLAAGVAGLVLLLGAGGAATPRPVRPSAPGPRDPALTVGTLPNGMRYYLRRNTSPKHRVELRLVVNAGSTLEDDDQRGFAHFLEHMAFNGTTHFPRNTLIDFLETSGMRFGADLNAYTTSDETVYMLTLPSDDRTILGKGLDVLQDWASGGITLDSAEVVAERGVIMGEWRMRSLLDTATQKLRAHYDTLFYGSSRYLDRQPIGDTTLIEHAEAGPIERFYHDWYRPDLMAVVVVGDFDQAQMEREIRRRFGAIPAPQHPRPRPAPTLRASREPVVDVYRGNVNPVVEVLWRAPADPADARAAERQRLVQELLAQEMEERLLRIREHPSRPYITAELEGGRIVRPLDVMGFELITWPDSLERGLATVLGQLEQVARYGVPAATLAHRKAVLLAHLEHAAASEGGRSSGSYADAYVQHYLTGEGSLLSAQQELALAREILPTLTPRALAEAARFWREPAGRLVFIQLPELAHVRPPTRESVLALFDSVARAPLAPDTARRTATVPLLATLPTPGKIVREKYDTAAGITEWTLSNGARVIVKPTPNDPDEVLVRAWSPGGFSVMPDSLFFTPGRMVARVMTDLGGLGSRNHDALAQQLSTTGLQRMTVDIGYADESISLAGSPRSLETLFQLLHRQFTAPMLDSATLVGWQSLAKYRVTGFSLDDQFNQIFARGNPRLLPVQTQLAELATVPQLMAAYRNRFGNAGDFTFMLVGAVTAKEVRPLVERYVASLPSTPERETPKKEDVEPFRHRVNTILPVLQVPKAQTLVVFDDTFPAAPDRYLLERQRLGALVTVLQDRVRVRLREELAGTYSPFVTSETYALPDEHYRVLIAFDAAPERMHELNRALMKLLDTVRTTEVSAAEAARAATIQRRQLETRLQENDYWMNAIGQYTRLGIPLDKIPAPYPEQEVTPAELEAAAKRYLPDNSYIHVTAMPEDSTSYTKADSADADASVKLTNR
ncbi:MAG: insulinase family protein [Gemmatimonadaceae bacterium]|nr:insulinase family protein [Gemmatimonadaceae bacterium]